MGIDRFNDETFNVSMEQMATPFPHNQPTEKPLKLNSGNINTTENISNIANQTSDLTSKFINKNPPTAFLHNEDGDDGENAGWDDYFSIPSYIDNQHDETSVCFYFFKNFY